MSFKSATDLLVHRSSRKIRTAMLVVVAVCQLPLPVGHDHDNLSAALDNGAMARHLALFHSGEPNCPGWHVHLIPPFLWNGGGADDATGTPSPESDAADGTPLVATVSADDFAPVATPVDAVATAERTRLQPKSGASPSHFLQTFGPAADLAGLLGVARC